MGNKKTTDIEAYSLIIKDRYYDNLEQIVDYIAFVQKQPLNALKVSDGISNAMSKIIDNPLIYTECENIPTKTKIFREAGYKSWLIVFKVKNNQVTILAVISGKQKPSVFRSVTR